MEDGLQNRKVGFIIQARMKSTRLPGKILMPLPLEGKLPLLGWITNKLKKSDFYNSIYIATSINPENDELLEFSNLHEVQCFRGSEDNVLSRFTSITKENDFDTIVRFTGDNPVLDIEILDQAIKFHFNSGADYTFTKNLPLGMNLEIIDSQALKNLDLDRLSPEDKEHVTLYIRRSGFFKKVEYKPKIDRDYQKVRLTIDYPSDFLVVSSLLSIGVHLNMEPGLRLVDYCLKEYPWLFTANNQNYQKVNYNNIQEEWSNVKPLLEKFEFKRIISLIKESI